VEGLAEGDAVLSDLQAAFKRHHALQCGFCTAGILMSCADWLSRSGRAAVPSEEQVREMLSGPSVPLHRLHAHRRGGPRRRAARAAQGASGHA
jgi:xanthine dehydrogenase iron-sulfur cluster and FAD-binding subunit A